MSRNPVIVGLGLWLIVGGCRCAQPSRPELIHPFTGLRPVQFHRLVRLVARRGGDAIADGWPGRPWALTLPDRVLLVAVYWRTNLTMRQIGPLFGVSHSAAHRVIEVVGLPLALTPLRRRPKDRVAIVDGTLIPTRDHGLATQSENFPLLGEPAGGDRREHPRGFRPVRATTWQPQRHDRLPQQRHRREACRADSDG